MAKPDRTDALLVAGMLAGAAIVAWSLVRDPAAVVRAWPDGVVATVAGEPIPRRAFEDAVAMVERDRGAPLAQDERRRVLERLVEEELLVQRGLALGLARSDRKLRGDLVAAVVEAVSAQADTGDPDEAALRDFHGSNPGLFAGAGTVRLAQVFVSSSVRGEDEAQARAREAERRLRAGEDVGRVRAALGDPPPVELPLGAVPVARVRDFVGAGSASAVAELAAGEVAEPRRGAGGWHVLVVLGREDAPLPGFDAVRADVLAEYRRREAEEAVRRTIDGLRAASDVVILDAALGGAEDGDERATDGGAAK